MATTAKDTRLKTGFYYGLLAVMAMIHVWVVSYGLDSPIRAPHSFRQAQTLISVFWMLREGVSIDYPMPVFGYPWTVPMEFPLYQWSVVGFVKLFDMPLELSGRLVALAWFYLGCAALFFVLRGLGFRLLYTVCVFGMILACPHYLFWSRVPLIESCAWAVGLIWVGFTIEAHKKESVIWILLMVVFGALAAIVKATTFLALVPLALALPAFDYWRLEGYKIELRLVWRQFKISLLGLIVGLIAGAIWVGYTDSIKEGQVIGYVFSSKYLKDWNFGELGDRIFADYWIEVVSNSQGYLFISSVFIFTGWVLNLYSGIKKLRWVGMSILFYLIPTLIFMNLYRVHDYYQYPVLLYLAVGAGYVIGYLIENIDNKAQLGYLLFTISFFISLSVLCYVNIYGRSLRVPILNYFPIVDYVKNIASMNAKVLHYNNLGNPEIAYACERKFILKMPREPFLGGSTQRIFNEKGNHPMEFLMIPIGDTGVDRPEFIADKLRGFDMVEEPVLIDDNINKVKLYISKKRAKELYKIQLAQFDSVKNALNSYKAKYGSYPKVRPEGACIGHNDWGGETRKDWIPGLVPEFLPHLPKEPRGNLFETGKQFYYISDGNSYKFFTMNPAGYYFFKLYHPEMVREANWKQVIIEG